MSDSVRPQRRQPTRLHHPWDSPGRNTGAGCHFLLQCMKVKSEIEVTQSCPTLSDPRDCSLPGSSVHGIFQSRVLEWGAIAFSRLYLRVCLIKGFRYIFLNISYIYVFCSWNWIFFETFFVKSKDIGQRYNISYYYYKECLYYRMITGVSNYLCFGE